MTLKRKIVELIDDSFIRKIYEGYIFKRRNKVLTDHLSRLIPQGANVLDIGCGDGQLDHLILQIRSDIEIKGIDIVQRKKSYIPVVLFDGEKVPYRDGSFDVALFVDVLHHTEDPLSLLKEAVRVTRKIIIVKDHTCNRFLAGLTLHIMDWIGNARYALSLPYNYWTKERWLEAFASLHVSVSEWDTNLKLYPVLADWIFGRSLQLIVRLELK
jgi:SAM-dependent methyltransferase